MLKTWEELISEGAIVVNNGVLTEGKGSTYALNTRAAPGSGGPFIEEEHTCNLIGELVLPNNGSVTSIGDEAFSLCTSITSMMIPDSVTSIGNSAFSACPNLVSITIPNSVTSIEPNTFGACSSLTSITIPDSVTSIGSQAFTACVNLTSITIGSNVEKIGYNAFYNCFKLTSATFKDADTWYYTSNSSYTGGTSVTVTNSSTAAFYLRSTYVSNYWYKDDEVE